MYITTLTSRQIDLRGVYSRGLFFVVNPSPAFGHVQVKVQPGLACTVILLCPLYNIHSVAYNVDQ